MLRITIQLADTLVIIHGTHAYYCGEIEQWFSVAGSEQLEVLPSVLSFSLRSEATQRGGMQKSFLGVITVQINIYRAVRTSRKIIVMLF